MQLLIWLGIFIVALWLLARVVSFITGVLFALLCAIALVALAYWIVRRVRARRRGAQERRE